MPLPSTTVTVHPSFVVGRVDPRIFGGFLEHMGRAVYGGVFDPDSRHADPFGCRTDVLEQLQRLEMTTMRYPGGNFVSGYHWRDGVGPVEQRPTVRELAWNSVEPNTFGTDEFLGLCERMSWEPMLAVNLGTGSPEEARDWVEYCNAPAGTKVADLRAAYGHPDPYAVGLWCLGNEMDGPWQLGHVSAEEYATRARMASQLMRGIDPSIHTVVCGSSGPDLPSYLEWDRRVLEGMGDQADFLSVHRYVNNFADDTPEFLASGRDVDRQIEQADAVCRYVRGRNRSAKRAYVCFDEWNVWYKDYETDGHGTVAPHLIEEVYNLEDALVVAGFLNSFIRHADVVKIANLAQVVNVIAPLLTRGDELLVQSIYHPFRMMSERRNGISLRTVVDGPTYATRARRAVPMIDASAILDGDVLHVFAVNRSVDQAAPVRVELAGANIGATVAVELLSGPGAKAANAFGEPPVVEPSPFDEIGLRSGVAEFELPPLSFAAASLRVA